MNERTHRLEHLPIPVETMGYYVDVNGISLSRSDDGSQRIGVFLQLSGLPEAATHLFMSPTDAAFLRDGLDEVLKAYRARQAGSN